MTEEQWLASDAPASMLVLVRGSASDRKLRLFASACCRRIWDRLPDPRSRWAVEVGERFADGEATRTELAAAQREAREVSFERRRRDLADPTQFTLLAASDVGCARAYDAATSATVDAAWPKPGDQGGLDWTEQVVQANLLRDIVGNPWRPAPFNPRWRTDDVLGLARAIYDDRDFERMPILGDALRDASCDEGEILAHCGRTEGHVRGCFLLDLVLGKE